MSKHKESITKVNSELKMKLRSELDKKCGQSKYFVLKSLVNDITKNDKNLIEENLKKRKFQIEKTNEKEHVLSNVKIEKNDEIENIDKIEKNDATEKNIEKQNELKKSKTKKLTVKREVNKKIKIDKTLEIKNEKDSEVKLEEKLEKKTRKKSKTKIDINEEQKLEENKKIKKKELEEHKEKELEENKEKELEENKEKELEENKEKIKKKKTKSVATKKEKKEFIDFTKYTEEKYEVKYKNKVYKVKYLPENFQQQWDDICKMREKNHAPVDTMGCFNCHDKEDPDLKKQRFQSLVSLMLSSQTRDEINYAAMDRLKSNNLSVDTIIKIDETKLAQIIKPVSFHNVKAKNLKRVAQILKDSYNSDIPRTRDDLCKLPGVGLKMANLVMKCAWNEITGIAVDTHVHRIANRLNWANSDKPEKTMEQLESYIPKDMWFDLNDLLVGFGQTICNSKKPKCEECLLKKNCDFYSKMF